MDFVLNITISFVRRTIDVVKWRKTFTQFIYASQLELMQFTIQPILQCSYRSFKLQFSIHFRRMFEIEIVEKHGLQKTMHKLIKTYRKIGSNPFILQFALIRKKKKKEEKTLAKRKAIEMKIQHENRLKEKEWFYI